MKGNKPDRDKLFLAIALERGFLDETRAAACREHKAKLFELGYSRSIAQVAVEKGFVSKEQAVEIRREMQKRGVLPRVGGYELLAKLGQGGMGAVYKARQLSLQRLVALKMLPPEVAKDRVFIERFRREGLIAAQIAHPNAVQIYDVGESGGRNYLVMEYVNGPSADRLLAKGPLPEKMALKIVKGVLSALDVAHEAGIVHRDIKPANILIDKGGFPKLADLGIARQTGTAGGTLTGTGMAIGTPHYMSPEQCRGEKDIDGRSDIYSLGATLYHLVCGISPYGKAESALAIIQAHIAEPLPDPSKTNPNLSTGICALIHRMMAKNREERPPNCAAVLAKIAKLERDASFSNEQRTVVLPRPSEAKSGPSLVTTPAAASPPPPPISSSGAGSSAARRKRKAVIGIGTLLLAACSLLMLPLLLGGQTNDALPSEDARGRPFAADRLEKRPQQVDTGLPSPPAGLASPPADLEQEQPDEAVAVALPPIEARPLPETQDSTQEQPIDYEGPVYSAWPFTGEEARRRQDETAQATGLPKEISVDLGGGVLLDLVLIPAGEFMMGGDRSAEEILRLRGGGGLLSWFTREHPQHPVRIPRPFYIGKYEVTQEQWHRTMGTNPSLFSGRGNLPVENVTWTECQEFVSRLNSLGQGTFRLPTEAEWEWACRAGTTSLYNTGDVLGRSGWFLGNSGGRTHPVGQKIPNAWGIYDMHGNVQEWCQTLFDNYPYSAADGRESLVAFGSRVARGGSWGHDPMSCRSSSRAMHVASSNNKHRGLRLLMEIPDAWPPERSDKPYYVADFDKAGAMPPGWRTFSGIWRATDGICEARMPQPYRRAYAFGPEAEWKNIVIECEVRIDQAQAGIVFRRSTSRELMLFRISVGEQSGSNRDEPAVYFERMRHLANPSSGDDFHGGILAEAPFAMPRAEWVNVRIEAFGPNLKAFVGGEEVLSHTEEYQSLKGGIGLMVCDSWFKPGIAFFRNLVVTPASGF